MGYVSLEKMTQDNKTSMYKLVLTAATRANELAKGVKPLIESDAKKVTAMALEEIAASKVSYEQGKKEGKK